MSLDCVGTKQEHMHEIALWNVKLQHTLTAVVTLRDFPDIHSTMERPTIFSR